MSYRINTQDYEDTKKQFNRYKNLLLRKAWFIIPVSLGILTLWMMFIYRYGFMTPVLQATSVLQFDNPDDISAVTERVPLQSDTRAALIKSRTFLQQVAQDISARLQTGRFIRSEIFDSIDVAEDAPDGEFLFRVTDSSYSLLYRTFDSEKPFSVIFSGLIKDLKNISFNKIVLNWTDAFYQAPYTFSFSIIPMRDAVNAIIDKLKIETSGLKGDILSITIKGKDKELITVIANSIADKFVDAYLLTKKTRRDTILNILQKQLLTAKNDMLNAEAALRNYRQQHPTLGMDDAFSTPVEIVSLKESAEEIKSTRQEGIELLRRYASVSDSSRTGVMAEMLSFLNRFKTATAEGLQNEFNSLTNEALNLKERYSPHHPEVKRNVRNLEQLGTKITNSLSLLIEQLERKKQEINHKIAQMSKDINNLPSRELQLYNLQRKYEVNSEIYSLVLTKYNEARLAKAVESGEIHVVDHASPPDEEADPKVIILLFSLGLFFGFSAGIGPVLLMDSFRKTVYSSEDLHRMTDLTVLESIPVKGKWCRNPSDAWLENIDDKIRDFHEETCRSLRTKILLQLHDQIPKRLLVTSLGTDEGKSFTAIHLGIALSQLEKPTLLIDADLHKGKLHDYLKVPAEGGLSEYLTSDKAIDAESFKQAVKKTNYPYLCCISNGKHDPKAHHLLNSDRLRSLIDFASNVFEVILIDTPPFAVVTDALSMQEIVSSYLIVVRSGKTNVTQLNKKIEEFSGFREKILGVILNGAPYKRMEYYYYTSYRTKKGEHN
ncbi:MAG TPA: polysaccharide biosynthesis tyrosine autokinase [Chitinispirillaceae bacterium]|nr:polysaccharide biosynthesis tyrosine autokinase [Chitinispirillaceae bacterium]